MKFIITLFFLCITIVTEAQFAIGKRSVSFTDPARSNRAVAADVYYPAQTAGTNAAFAAGEFPVLVFGHGFVMTVDAYDLIWEELVPEGYIMILPTTEGSFSPSHSNFGADLAFLNRKMKEEGINASSPFFGKIAATSAVMGHSMGGGASFLAAASDTSFTALCTFAPANTTPSSAVAAADVTIPALVFAGANDCVTPPAQHQIPMYDSLASDCKTYISITGASHCQFANSNTFCNIGEATCTPAPTINRTTQLNTVFTYLLPWLDYQLKADTSAGNSFQTLLLGSSGLTYQQNCSLTTISALEQSEQGDFVLIQQQNNNTVRVKFPELLNDVSFQLYDLSGKAVYTAENQSGTEFSMDLSALNPGFYFLTILDKGKKRTSFKIVK